MSCLAPRCAWIPGFQRGTRGKRWVRVRWTDEAIVDLERLHSFL